MNDYHTHTSFSDDCRTPMKEMILGAIRKGVKELAITDHYDPGYGDPDYPFSLNFKLYHQALLDAEATYKGNIKIIKGLELGIMEGQLEEGGRRVNTFPYDFVIGSFHSFQGSPLHLLDYSYPDKSSFVRNFYTYVSRCLKAFSDYDVIGHLTILDRYMDTICDDTPHLDLLDEILKTIIGDGKGLEINTSSFHYRNKPWLPRKEILQRYRELGGEVLTFGSDTHSPDFFLYHFEDAMALAKSLGFRYYTTFSNRKPIFLPL